jgi:threonine dehydrogenase-like Zn-dependent dehydrogenase
VKAVILKEPGVASVETVEDATETANEVLLRVRMIGLCGSDLNSFRGKNPMISFPRIPGHEIGATVVSGNASLKPGTDVTVVPYTHCGVCTSCLRGRTNACQFNQTLGVQRDGALTEYLSVPASKLITGKLSVKELCLVEPLTVGFHAIARGRVTSADTVAVIGCGGVGLGAVAGAHERGANTIGIDVDQGKLALAKLAGAKYVINTKSEDLHERLLELTNGRGPDVVVEAIGLPQTFVAAVEEVAFTGRVVYIGYTKELVAYETRLFVQKELDVLGSRNALPEDFEAVVRMLEEKRFPVDAAVSSIIPMEAVPEALQAWSANPAQVQKILVTIEDVSSIAQLRFRHCPSQPKGPLCTITTLQRRTLSHRSPPVLRCFPRAA